MSLGPCSWDRGCQDIRISTGQDRTGLFASVGNCGLPPLGAPPQPACEHAGQKGSVRGTKEAQDVLALSILSPRLSNVTASQGDSLMPF